MINILKTIFGSGDVIKEGFSLIDSIHTSKEEEIAAKTEQKVRIMESYAPFKVAQRYIAVMFTVTFLVCFFSAFVNVVFLETPVPEGLIPLMNEFYIGEIMLAIVGFYFMGGVAESVGRSKKDGS